MGIQSAKDKLIERIQTVAETSSSLEEMSYAAAGLAKLAETQDSIVNPDIFTIGKPGTFGFGVGALRDDEIPTGWTALPGHQDPASPNYGNYLDPHGSHMVFIPKFYFRWNGNSPEVSATPATGFVLHEAFRFASKGFFRDKTHVANVGGLPIAKIGEAPISTSTANNPVGNLTGAPANTYAGFIDAMKFRGNDHHCETIFESNALAILALAHSNASSSAAVCAFKDTLPHLPKGNNNNALGDTNDPNVKFTTAGNATYPTCALTGSGFPFAKTTHNGQACGVADVNGNLWRINIGMTKANNTDGIFQILKTTVDPNSLNSANLHDAALYDTIDLTATVPTATGGWMRFGNGTNQVFSTATDSLSVRKVCAGIPEGTGVSAGGTDNFGSDGLYRYWRTNMVPLVGADWGNGSFAGVFARGLSTASSNSHSHVGGSACVTL